MATGIKVCKICGKEYECCKTVRQVPGVFRWQDVACCVEHGQEYLNLVLAARAGALDQETPKSDPDLKEQVPVSQKKPMRKKAKAEEKAEE